MLSDNLTYDEIARVESKVGAGNLGSLSAADAARLARQYCSFSGDTLVITQLGYREIQDIVAGQDRVWARDELTGTMAWREVLDQYTNRYDETVYVTTIDQNGHQQTIRSNRIHPYFARLAARPTKTSSGRASVATEGYIYKGDIVGGAWVDAQYLKPGDQLLSDKNHWQTVESVVIEYSPLDAYNLTVDDYSTYFVAGNIEAEAVWVHNVCHGYSKQFPNDASAVSNLAVQNTGKAGDGGILRANMARVGFSEPVGNSSAAHHITSFPRERTDMRENLS